jgi:hypothetical protein
MSLIKPNKLNSSFIVHKLVRVGKKLKIRECCDGIKTMIRENTFRISNISQKGWMKVLEHDGINGIGKRSKTS